MKRVQAFKSQLGGLDDLFDSERQRDKRMSKEKEEAQRRKACESKNRYSSRDEARAAIAACKEYEAKDLQTYRCPYCDGWHLTSHPWEE